MVLVGMELRSYAEAIGGAIEGCRSHLEVAVVEPDDLDQEIARLDPALVLCSRHEDLTGSSPTSWVELPGDGGHEARVCLRGRRLELASPSLEDLLSVIDEAELVIEKEGR